MIFSEDSRVKIPCILHLVRLGFRYLSLKNAVWDEETNIFPELFHAAIARINPGIESADIDRLLADVKLSLENEDLGKAFYEKLTERSGTRLADLLAVEDDTVENEVLRDNNLNVIKRSPEFIGNKSPGTPTNRICTSLFSRDRLSFLLQYALVYVNDTDGLHKHVMRYPQIFATKAIERKLNAGVRKGIIWHTQGSGKTALAYYNTRFLTDYFQCQGIIPKFYFIVDRIDLLIQAQREFFYRGLTVQPSTLEKPLPATSRRPRPCTTHAVESWGKRVKQPVPSSNFL